MIIYKIIRNTFYTKYPCAVEGCGAVIKSGEKFGFTASPRMEVARCMDHINALIVAGAEHRGSGTRDEYVLVDWPASRQPAGGFKTAVLTPVYHHTALQLCKVINQPIEPNYERKS